MSEGGREGEGCMVDDKVRQGVRGREGGKKWDVAVEGKMKGV